MRYNVEEARVHISICVRTDVYQLHPVHGDVKGDGRSHAVIERKTRQSRRSTVTLRKP